MATQSLNLKIISPQDILFQGEVYAVSSKNSSGDFDILPEHTDFITIIENQPIVIRKTPKEKITFHFPLAIMYTNENIVTIYAKTASPEL